MPQATGILRTWNDDKGFGFIAPTHGGRELFVHISAFPRDGSRPTVGESLSYELGQGRDGKPQAVRVVRKAVGMQKPPARPAGLSRQRPRSRLGSMVAVVIVMAMVAHGVKQYQGHAHRQELRALPPAQAQPAAIQSERPSSFRCDGRTHCSQMTSCQEATWFVNNCPGTQMDGDQDGVPCEQQHCNGSVFQLTLFLMNEITWSDFTKVELRVGRIVGAEAFPEARKPAYKLHVDFGPELGIRKSSAQITSLYTPDELVGKLVVAVVNFPRKQIGPLMSECLVTGFHNEQGEVALCVPDRPVPLGTKLL